MDTETFIFCIFVSKIKIVCNANTGFYCILKEDNTAKTE